MRTEIGSFDGERHIRSQVALARAAQSFLGSLSRAVKYIDDRQPMQKPTTNKGDSVNCHTPIRYLLLNQRENSERQQHSQAIRSGVVP